MGQVLENSRATEHSGRRGGDQRMRYIRAGSDIDGVMQNLTVRYRWFKESLIPVVVRVPPRNETWGWGLASQRCRVEAREVYSGKAESGLKSP